MKLLDISHFKKKGVDDTIVQMRHDHHLLKLKDNLNGIIEQRNQIIDTQKQLSRETKQDKRHTLKIDVADLGPLKLDSKQESLAQDESTAAGTTNVGGSAFDFMTSVAIEEKSEPTEKNSPKSSKKVKERTANTSNVQKRKEVSPVSFFEQNLVRQQNYFNSVTQHTQRLHKVTTALIKKDKRADSTLQNIKLNADHMLS